jgi:hypothetical protein
MGTFPPLKNQFRALDFSKGDTEIRIVGGGERHTGDAEKIVVGFRERP